QHTQPEERRGWVRWTDEVGKGGNEMSGNRPRDHGSYMLVGKTYPPLTCCQESARKNWMVSQGVRFLPATYFCEILGPDSPA
ncbi:hypothetical protein D6779_08455, partial [Candidatus Parcubacteria bacterium]